MIPSSGTNALAAALGIDEPATSTTMPRPRPGTRTSGASFLDELTGATEDADKAREQQAALLQVPRLLKLIMLLELLGLPVPKAMIATLRTAGLTSMADGLEARNRRLEKEQQESRPTRAAA